MSRRPPGGRARGNPPAPLQVGLARVDTLLAARKYVEAKQVLAELDQRFREHPEVLIRMLSLAATMNDVAAMGAAAKPLARLRPDDPTVALNLAIARLKLQQFAHAYTGFDTFARRWPSHPEAEQARLQAHDLKALLAERWAAYGLAEPLELDLLVRNEELQDLLTTGQWRQAITLGQQALREHPDFVAIRNNLSLAYQNFGQIDQAISEAWHVLTLDPHNLHALGNLTRFLVLAGRLDEAAAQAEQLKAIPTLNVAIAVKQAEALSFFGDDAGVLAVFDQVQKLKDRDDSPLDSAVLHHLAAVAALRQGHAQAARRRWQKAMELNPGLELAAGNLADLNKPVDERHAPWPYTIEYWLQRTIVDELIRDLGSSKQRDDGALTRIARRFLQRHQAVAAVLPLLLDRGDPVGREFALHVSGLAQTPELLAALATFAQGQFGPVQTRMRAAQIAQQSGALANGIVRFWHGGDWHDTLMIGMELHGEPTPSPLPPAVVALQREAAMAQRAGKLSKTEDLLHQALTEVPDDPSLLNNLGAVYSAQGRSAEAEAIIRRLVAEYPDYLFGRTNMVSYLIREGKLDEARALIDPLLQRSRMHFVEFSAVASAQVEIALAQGNSESAESWLRMWEQTMPDHPLLESYQARLETVRRATRRAKRKR